MALPLCLIMMTSGMKVSVNNIAETPSAQRNAECLSPLSAILGVRSLSRRCSSGRLCVVASDPMLPMMSLEDYL